MGLYTTMFKVYGVLVALGDVQHRSRRLAACGTIDTLCKGGIVPIVNQNDAVPEPDGEGAGADGQRVGTLFTVA
eukprot:gene50260-25587_t